MLLVVLYGTWKSRRNRNMEDYLLGDKKLTWGTIGLSVMATQASAITFLSTPGQAYDAGMGFIQNYIGQPIALILVCAFFIPIFFRLKVYTAYEYLENRFDLKNRSLAAFLFLLQRGFAAGITIYAPAIILSSMLGWNLNLTILSVGIFVVIYTVLGGTKGVSLTQKWQMAVIMIGMFTTFFIIVMKLPAGIEFSDALTLAGKMGKTETINFDLDFQERYTFWSGITGGLFLALSYFGTDQSQVQRYIGAENITQSRIGLIFNAILKIPMQFFILLLGVMVFIFFQFQPHDVLFDTSSIQKLEQTEYASKLDSLRTEYQQNHEAKKAAIYQAFENSEELDNPATVAEINKLYGVERQISKEAKETLTTAYPELTQKDSDYVFLNFIMNFLPTGLVGFLMAVILMAAMSSTAGELNALGSTATVDFYKRLIRPKASDAHYVIASKALTAAWGVIAIAFALLSDLFENLIEAVNILGSLFYGTILGLFITAFFVKYVRNSNAVFIAALIAQATVFFLFAFFRKDIGYLYYNVIACVELVVIAIIIQAFTHKKTSGGEPQEV